MLSSSRLHKRHLCSVSAGFRLRTLIALWTYFLHCLSSASFESGVPNELNTFLKSILNRTRFFQFRMQFGFIFLVMRLVRWSVMP